MKLRAKYLMAFMSTTLFTIVVVGISLWGFNSLRATTDMLFEVHSKILEYANNFDKELAHSRRAEKEFFIFPDNPKKQQKYMADWKASYEKLAADLNVLEDLYHKVDNKKLLEQVAKAREIMTANDKEFDAYTAKFQKTKSYSVVDKEEYGFFKNRTHELEEIANLMSVSGLTAVRQGSYELQIVREKTEFAIKLAAVLAILWGIVLSLVLSRRLSQKILYLAGVGNSISQGRMEAEIQMTRKDELGELALAMKRMQKSVGILMERLANR